MNAIAGFLSLCVFLVGLALFAVYYGAVVWNDFNTRWQNLWRILADIRSIRAHGRGVAGSVNHHIGHAKHHEQQIASRAPAATREAEASSTSLTT